MRTLVVLALVAACSSPPADPDPAALEWQVALRDLDDAVLSVCSGGDRLIAVGGDSGHGAVYEWRSDHWSVPPLPAASGLLWWCWVGDDGRAYATGEGRTVIASDTPGAWQREPVAASEADSDVALYGVWGEPGGEVIAVGGSLAPGGDRGVVLVRDTAGAWQRARDPAIPPEILFKLWSAPGGPLWVVGTGGVILTREDGAWRAVTSPTGDRLIAVWGNAADDVYAVGGDAGGLVLHYDGTAWSVFDRPPSRVSGLYTAPGAPLYVAGDRGFVGRYRLGPSGRPSAAARDVRITLDGVDLHALTGRGELVIACGADLAGGGAGSWRGALLTHGGTLGDDVDRLPVPDAGPVDAAGPDAEPSDAGPAPGPGEACASPPPTCRADLECWGLVESDEFLCTERCTDASDCTDPGYGPSPCCAIPGFQTLQTVCIPGDRIECQ